VKLVFSREAEQDVERTDAWWREHRPDAPRLFAEELAKVCQEIQRNPLLAQPFLERRGVIVRRRLLQRTDRHVYYVADTEAGIVTVLRVWGARRGRGPKL
jgi:plasmid stabilization system protein ParE